MKKTLFFGLLLLCGVFGSCATNKSLKPQEIKKYNVDLESDITSTMLDGLPEGIKLSDVNNMINANVKERLSKNENIEPNGSNKIKAIYIIKYFGHKYTGVIRVKYLLNVSIKTIDANTNKIIKNESFEVDDTVLLKAINKICETISDSIIDALEL